MSQHDRRFRTLIAIRYLDPDRRLVGLWAAGRSASEIIEIHLSVIPSHILDVMVPDKMLHAIANIGAAEAKDIVFSDWEMD